MKKYITRALKSLARRVVQSKMMRSIIQLMDDNKLNNLIGQFKKCGANVTIFMPVIIQNPENVEIGNQVSIAPFVHMWGLGGIKIGDRVMIASHCALTSLSHDYGQEFMNTTQTQGEINIEDDVWIGAHSVVLPGVTIGRGAVIGAGSIVTHDIAPYTIAFGMPARRYKKRVTSQKQKYRGGS